MLHKASELDVEDFYLMFALQPSELGEVYLDVVEELLLAGQVERASRRVQGGLERGVGGLR